MTQNMTVGELERHLFCAFPLEDAESWDQPGLAVGNRTELVGKIGVCLDMSESAVIAADEAGCNVLLTHHPPFIKEGPSEFGPADQRQTTGPGRMVYEAARRGLNTIAMHTNADRAIATRRKFADMLGCACEGNCEFLFDASREAGSTGYGALLRPDWDARPTLGLVATMCAQNFGGSPRVWGMPDMLIDHIAFLNGSWGDPSTYDWCISAGIDCIVVGETRYHVCVDAQPHLAIIELGHDRSELPIVDVLCSSMLGFGIAQDDIVDLRDTQTSWWTAQ
jgi:putative NIF3 family GTP cyclohydrolase 1 type 2